MPLTDEFRRRRLVPWGLGYAAAAFALLQGLDLVAQRFDWPDSVSRVLIIGAVVGFFVTLVLAWFHGERGLQRATGTELALLAVLLAAGIGLAWRFAGTQAPAPPTPSVAAAAPVDPAPTAVPAPADKSVAVLPFASLAGGEDNALFADGLSEEIINSLSRVPDLQVAARSSSFALRDSGLGATDIAARLRVSHVLEGSIRRAGQRLRISVQLIRAKDGFTLWTENYDRSDQDIIAIQEDVARSIAQALKTVTDPASLAEMQRAGTRSVAAYHAYIKGLALVGKAAETGDFELSAGALPAFDLATSIDPDFEEARMDAIALARSTLDVTTFNPRSVLRTPYDVLLRDYTRRLDEARDHMRDPSMVAYLQAQRALVDLRFADALRLVEVHLQAHPDAEESRQQAALISRTLGQTEVARTHVERLFARADSVRATTAAMGEMVRLGDYPRGVEMAREALRRFPGHAGVMYQAQRAFLSAGRIAEAATLVPALVASDVDDETRVLVQLRQACGEGRRVDAEALFRRIDRPAPDPLPRWHGLLLLGRTAEAEAMLAPYDRPERLYAIWPFMTYPKFNVARYPHLRASLERQGIAIRPPVAEPYNCPAAAP